MTQKEHTHEQLIKGLQEDLAREYQAVIQYVVYWSKRPANARATR